MCGICGWLNTRKRIDFSVFEKMNNIVSYRGPDDEGYTAFSEHKTTHYKGKDSCDIDIPMLSENDDDVFMMFGHRRLSILDLSSAGHQPMQSLDGDLCVTYNGEIYNYIELREQLIDKGYKFQSSCDTEVLLYAYKEWGEKCVSHFNGMWAFAIWDKKEQKLFCSRDRLGAKPFYYYADGENFIFSSELKQICHNPIVPRKINDELLITQIVWGITDFSEETLIRDIKTLQGGYNLTVKLSFSDENIQIVNMNVSNYWDVDTKNKRDSRVCEELFEIHQDAVAKRTRSDVPIGILLSGGLDSSALVAGVSKHYKTQGIEPKKVSTFTSCYKDFPEGDEKDFARLVNEYCGVTGNYVYPDEEDTFSTYKEFIWHVEGQYGISALGAFMTLKEVAKSGIKVLINGQGSDETMFGYERYYGWYLRDIWNHEGIAAFWREFNRIVANSRLSRRELIEYIFYFNNYRIRKIRNIKRMENVATPYCIENARKNDKVKEWISFETLSALQYNEIRGTQLTHILRGDDRMYMAFSMESRVPFIDYRYIEKAVQLPEHEKITGGYTKYPLRKYVDGLLPDEVVWRRNKMGWPSPRKRWIDRFNKTELESLFVDARSSKFFRIDAVKKMFQQNPYSYGVEQFLNTEIFMRLFDVE